MTHAKPSLHVLEIDDSNFEREVLGSELPFLLDFTATWCAPCRVLAPIVDALADEHVGTFKVGTLDIDRAPGVAARFGVRGAPTLIVFKDGREAARRLGTANKATLLKLVAPDGTARVA
jgi:thioredoxin 1